MQLVSTIRQEELLYSAIARGGRYLPAPGAGPFMRELLGRRWGIASIDLPGDLDELARDRPEKEREAVVDDWIDRATILPFHTAFMPSSVRKEARHAMRGSVVGLYTRLGLAAFRVRSPGQLRFCPDCLVSMETDGFDLWWRRDHQLPGISVCPVHGTVLRLSDVRPGDDRHAFIAATRAVCRDDAPQALDGADEEVVALMADLARRAAALLVSPPRPRDFGEIMEDYRGRLAEVGLMRSRRRVDQLALQAAFRERWGRVPDLVPGLELAQDEERSWLSALTRNGRRAAHPLQHLMLGAVLDDLAASPANEPFGPGPWPCRNPLADHHGRDVIPTVSVRRDRDILYGDFACSCGYLYTRSRTSEGGVGEPRYRRFGPLLAPVLKAAVARGDGLRATARKLNLDPKTLIREAAMAGLQVPWTTGASGKVPEPIVSVPPTASRVGRRRRRRAIRNWFAIDTRLARSARSVAAAIQLEEPPIRVTFAGIERRVARRDWVQKRRKKLPQTVKVMEEVVETTEAFRSRRLAWHVSRAAETGDLRPCDILRAAGLPMGWLPNVRAAVAAARCILDHARLAA